MIEITASRGTPLWRAAHAKRITASDAHAIMSSDGTKLRAKLIERLVLDFEGVDNHTDEEPDSWAEQHEQDIVNGVAAYRREMHIDCTTTGMVGSSILSWLVCSPHALTYDGAVLIRARRSMRSFREQADKLGRADKAKAQLVAWICDRQWCDVVDYLDQRGMADDLIHVQHVPVDQEWLLGTVIPRLVTVWQAVQRQLKDRTRQAIKRSAGDAA